MPSATPAGLHVGQAAVGQRLGLEVDVAEAPGPVERQLGGGQSIGRIVDLAAHRGDRHPALLDAGRLVLHQPPGPGNQARPAVKLPRTLANTSPSRTQAMAAARQSRASVKPRTAADRWATVASTSSRAIASCAIASERSASSLPATGPASHPGPGRGGSPTEGGACGARGAKPGAGGQGDQCPHGKFALFRRPASPLAAFRLLEIATAIPRRRALPVTNLTRRRQGNCYRRRH